MNRDDWITIIFVGTIILASSLVALWLTGNLNGIDGYIRFRTG